MTGKKLLRSTNDKWVAGILGGIAEYLDWDPAILRLAYVLLTVFSAGFPGILIYIFLWIVMPKQ
ncbi:PspC domain-containing protein [Prevotella sp. A2931]|uniref:PspC domain-containing protein n=1 Tax=Prevotella illustrans TaxID=2800387 RepID=A0ABS3M519_9BACT|nr:MULTISPECIES: PspC domain-containing protein [Prevotella]MBO1363267.1 PspC domain-containing protein [Prevotella illustrans]PTL26589.1 PspC domain-containing protein [Prevotella sp. oral taxon 820]